MVGWGQRYIDLKRTVTGCAASVICFILIMGSSQNAAAAVPEVRFCFNEWQPYATVRDGEPTGISIEILRAAATRVGIPAVFTELPWKRCLKMVLDGEQDAVVDAAARENFLQGPTSVTRYSNTFWVRDRDRTETFAQAARSGHKVGLIDGYNYPPALQALIDASGTEIEYSADDASSIRKLSFNRVDIIIADMVGTMVFAREYGLKLRPLQPSHSADRLYPSFNKARAAQQRAFDRALAELLANGEVDRIYMKYTGMGFDEILAKTDAGQP